MWETLFLPLYTYLKLVELIQSEIWWNIGIYTICSCGKHRHNRHPILGRSPDKSHQQKDSGKQKLIILLLHDWDLNTALWKDTTALTACVTNLHFFTSMTACICKPRRGGGSKVGGSRVYGFGGKGVVLHHCWRCGSSMLLQASTSPSLDLFRQ